MQFIHIIKDDPTIFDCLYLVLRGETNICLPIHIRLEQCSTGFERNKLFITFYIQVKNLLKRPPILKS